MTIAGGVAAIGNTLEGAFMHLSTIRSAGMIAIVAASLAIMGCRGDKASTAVPPASKPDLTMSASPAAATKYLKAADFDLKSILGNPPAKDSDDHAAELDKLLELQARRTPEQEARCKSEEIVTVFAFADVIGPWFNEKNLPLTRDLMQQSFTDARAVSDSAKKIYNRLRPPLEEPQRVKPCVKLEPTNSFPSGHATRGLMWAILLSEIFPEKHNALMTRGTEIGNNRVLGGMHWPTDVEAGQRLGPVIAAKLLANPAFKADFEKVKAEILAAQPK